MTTDEIERLPTHVRYQREEYRVYVIEPRERFYACDMAADDPDYNWDAYALHLFYRASVFGGDDHENFVTPRADLSHDNVVKWGWTPTCLYQQE
jgi:hypothetical protein